MELLQLKYFRDAAKLENFSKVAERYMVPPSSVSHTIAKLEKEIGVKLFTRIGNKIFLNEAGKAFYADIKTALDLLDRGVHRARHVMHKNVRLSITQGSQVLIPLISAFKEIRPEVEFSFVKRSDKETSGNLFDILITAKPFAGESNYNLTLLYEERIMVAVSEKNPLAKKSTVTFEDVCNLPVVGLYPPSKAQRQIDAYFEQHMYKPNVVAESVNQSTIGDYVKEDFGIAFYPEISWSQIKKSGVVSVPLSDMHLSRSVYMCTPKGVESSEAVKDFIDFAAERVPEITRGITGRM